MRITRTLAVPLAVSLAVMVAPAAQSRSPDTHAAVAQAQPSDMHASVALAAAAARRQRADSRAVRVGVQPAAPANATDDDHAANGLGAVAALLVIGGFAFLHSRRGPRSQRLRAGH